MALKAGASHAFSTLLLTLLAAILIQYLKEIRFFEFIFRINEFNANLIAPNLSTFFNIEVPVVLIEYLSFAFILSFIWGLIYHYARV